VIVCLSSTAVEKTGFIHKEISVALDQADRLPDGEIFLVPVRISECTVPLRLRKFHYADLFEPSGIGKLIEALRIRHTKLAIQARRTGTLEIQDNQSGTSNATALRFRRAFAEVCWDAEPSQARSGRSLNIAIVGQRGSGKTALTYVLTETERSFLIVEDSLSHAGLSTFQGSIGSVVMREFDVRDPVAREAALHTADLVLDIASSDDQTAPIPWTAAGTHAAARILHILTKCDLIRSEELETRLSASDSALRATCLPVSSLDGTGIELLRRLILSFRALSLPR
jgi:hypothetical protein